MKAAVLVDKCKLQVCDVPLPPLRPHHVRVRTTGVGICGTDLHIYSGHANYNFDSSGEPIPLSVQPQILGHEISGVVEEIGRDVGDLKPGDRVVLDQGMNCRSFQIEPVCEYCASGDSHQCLNSRELGITGQPGGFADYLNVPAVNAVRIEGDVPQAEAGLAEPLGGIIHAIERADRSGARYSFSSGQPPKNILIFGCGPVGLMFIQYLRNIRNFDGPIYAVDLNSRKLALAERFGAIPISLTGEDLVGDLIERTGGQKVHYMIEASGAGAVFQVMPAILRKQATVVLFGHGHTGFDIGLINRLQYLEPAVVCPGGASGGFDADGRPTTYRRAMQALVEGKIQVGPLLTHRCDLETLPRVFGHDYFQPEFIKAVLLPK